MTPQTQLQVLLRICILVSSSCTAYADDQPDPRAALPPLIVELEHDRLLVGELPRVRVRIEAKDSTWNVIKPERLAISGNIDFQVTNPRFERQPAQRMYGIGSGPKRVDWVKLDPGAFVEGLVPVNFRTTMPGTHLIAVSLSPTGDPHARASITLKLTVENVRHEDLLWRIDGRVRVSDAPQRRSDFDGTVSFLVLKTESGRELVYHFRADQPDGDADMITSRLWKVDGKIKLLDIAVSATQPETYNREIWLRFEDDRGEQLLRLRQNGGEIISRAEP